MEKVRFGERSGNYVQEIDMQELVVKCDVCLRQLVPNEKDMTQEQGLKGKLDGGIINYKDICLECSKELYNMIKTFEETKRLDSNG